MVNPFPIRLSSKEICPLEKKNNAMKNGILKLTKQKQYDEIRTILENTSGQIKGNLFEWYLAELYSGNGWLTKVQGGRGDKGADILLYHPKTPSVVSLIVQAKNHSKPLTFDQTKIEFIKFEQQAAPKYSCEQFNLITINGFVEEAEKLGEFNMLLSSWDDVINLINSYDPDFKAEPEIELFAYNRITYRKIQFLSIKNNCVAVIQATGTGKSYIIAKVMADFLQERKLVMAPNNYILEQQKSKVPWASHSTTFMTYTKGANLTDLEIEDSNVKLIILDEFHRCGADFWGAGVQRILKAHNDSFVLGTSATPIRYLDQNRDMADELFEGVVAANLSLTDAIVKKILPSPTYIAALYTLDEEINNLIEVLNKSKKSDEEKKEIAAEIRQMQLNWEKTSGVPEILKKNLTPQINKIIIFCKDQEHLDQMEAEVPKWFQKAKIHRWRKIYRVLSADPESDQHLEDFKNSKKNETVHLLFAIDMLNEGLHIPDVGAVILLRPTESPIVFYQQIGRCIQVNSKHVPVIFDLVNNFRSIRTNDFLDDLEEALDYENFKRTALGLEEISPHIHIFDETKEILEIFDEISDRLHPWEVMFSKLVEFKKEYDHCNVPKDWNIDKSLGIWVDSQRQNMKHNKLGIEQIGKLDNIGFVWNPIETLWRKMFCELMEFKVKYGHCDVPKTWAINPTLGGWVSRQRVLYKKGLLGYSQIQKLNELGISWDTKQSQWEKMFSLINEYKKQHGHCNIPQNFEENPSLGSWVTSLRIRKKRGTLTIEQIEQLDDIDFIWEPIFESWEKMFSKLVEFKNEYGHCNVPPKIWAKDPQLGGWVSEQRAKMKRGSLGEEFKTRLKEIGFTWNILGAAWEEKFSKLLEFKNEFGHCDVSRTDPEHSRLAVWVSNQRRLRNINKLNSNKINRLEALRFTWDTIESSWEVMFSCLKNFKSENGHCHVPYNWEGNPKLFTWVSNQRANLKKGKLRTDRKKRLDKIGFIWDTRDTAWEKKFTKLIEFKNEYGHCNVSQKWTKDLQLGKWVSHQRSFRRNGKISSERIQKLDQIGFRWE